MSRWYVELSCGCLASCDAGGGLIPCDGDQCEFKKWKREHPLCPICGDCLVCCRDHTDCDLFTLATKKETVTLRCKGREDIVGEISFADELPYSPYWLFFKIKDVIIWGASSVVDNLILIDEGCIQQ